MIEVATQQQTELAVATDAVAKREEVIEQLGFLKTTARKNKKGAAVVAAFDVLEDLVIARADGGTTEDMLARIDRFVTEFKG